MKFFGMVKNNHAPACSRLEVAKGQKVKIVFFVANNSVQNCHRESGQKLECSSFNSIFFLCMIMAIGLAVSKTGGGQRSEGSGLPWRRFALSECF